MNEQERQAIIDEEHLKLLPIGYWVSAGFWGAYGLFMVAYFGLLGSVFLLGSATGDASDMPPGFGFLFFGFGLAMFLVLGVLVFLKARVGFWMRERKHYVGTLIVAGISCLEIPYGTLLGVFTFIALSRPSMKALYEKAATEAAEPVEVDATLEESLPAE